MWYLESMAEGIMLANGRTALRMTLFALLAAACASGPKVPPAPPPDLGDRLTYSWSPDIQLNARLGTRERLRRLDQIIRGTVDEELARRGYQQIASGSTDMTVSYRILLEHKDTRSLRDYVDYRALGGQASPGGVLGGYTEGTLVIELLDGFSHQPLWQSSSSAVPDPKGQGERLAPIVRSMMAPLPMR
jgi:hypothetical protein